jgi:YbbR domain-containing protein
MKKRKITDNIPLKIMSVAIAVVLWLIVVNIDNPTGTNYYTLNGIKSRTVGDGQHGTARFGKMCMPEQNQDSIKVAITATKKIRDKIKVTDISAVADLQQAVSLDTNPVMVPITVTCSVPGVSPSDIKVTPQNLSVNLDEKETQEFGKCQQR